MRLSVFINSFSQSVKTAFVVCKRHIFQNCHGRTGSKRRILIHSSDLPVSFILFHAGNIFPMHQNLSCFYRNTAAQDIKHGSLSGAVASYHRNKISLFYCQIKIFKQTHFIDCSWIIIFMNMF